MLLNCLNRVNDRVVKINDVDLKSIESDAFQELITNLKGSCVFVRLSN